MKIDFHIHVTPPEIINDWENIAESEPYFSLLFKQNIVLRKSKKFATSDEAVSEIKKSNFDKAVIFGFAFNDIGLCRLVNDYVIDSIKKYPDKLTGFCVVPPCIEAGKEIERCYNAGLKGVGELFPFGQNINLTDIDQTRLITDTCVKLNLPLLLHVNENVGHDYVGKTPVPLKDIETFVINNPNLKIILAHFGGGLLFYESMPEIKESFKNVFYDTAASPFLYDSRIYDAIKALGLCKKVLFGSDYPLLKPDRYIDALNKSDLNDKEKEMILGENAKILLTTNDTNPVIDIN